MSIDNPHKIAKKDGHLHEIAKNKLLVYNPVFIPSLTA